MAQQDPVFQFLNTMPQMLMNVYSQRQREKQAIRDYLNKLNLEIARYGGDIIDVPEGLSAKELERFVPQAIREIRETFAEQRSEEEQSRELSGIKSNIESYRRALVNAGVPVGNIPELKSVEAAQNYLLTLQNTLSKEVAKEEQSQQNYRELSLLENIMDNTIKQLQDIKEKQFPGEKMSPEDADKIGKLTAQYERASGRYTQLLPEGIRNTLIGTDELGLNLDPDDTGGGGETEPPPDNKIHKRPDPWDKYTRQRPTREIPERVKAGTFTDSGVMIDPISAAVMNLLRRFQIPSGTEPPLPDLLGRYGEGDIIDLLRQKAQRERGEFVRPQRPTYQTQQYRY